MSTVSRKIEYGAASLIAFARLAVLLCPLDAAELGAGVETKGRETPYALVVTHDDAIARKDWKTCFSCYDAKARAGMFGPLFHGIAMSHDETLNAIVKKHMGDRLPGAEVVAIPVVRPDTRMFKDLRMFEKIQQQFRDLPAFVDEISRWGDAKGGETLFQKLGDVKDIKIEGDTAVGHGKQNLTPPLDLPVQIHFCKIDGRWYLTIPDPPAPLSVAERAKQLQAEVDTLWITLTCSGPATLGGPKYGEVRMGVQPFVYKSNKPTLHLLQLSKAQAKKLIEYLATEGFLQQALELGKQEISDRERQNHGYRYVLQVSTTNLQPTEDRGLKLHEDLGWGPGLVKRLEGLRGALDEEGARAIDAIIAGLGDEGKEVGKR